MLSETLEAVCFTHQLQSRTGQSQPARLSSWQLSLLGKAAVAAPPSCYPLPHPALQHFSPPGSPVTWASQTLVVQSPNSSFFLHRKPQFFPVHTRDLVWSRRLLLTSSFENRPIHSSPESTKPGSFKLQQCGCQTAGSPAMLGQ